MQESKEYLEKSVRCYQNLLEHVEQFKHAIEKSILSADQFNSYNTKLVAFQAEVESADKSFSSHFEDKTETLITDTLLLKKRMEMMNEILEINEFLLPRLASLMDVTKDELLKLKTSMTKVGGYHSGASQSSGKIIKRSC